MTIAAMTSMRQLILVWLEEGRVAIQDQKKTCIHAALASKRQRQSVTFETKILFVITSRTKLEYESSPDLWLSSDVVLNTTLKCSYIFEHWGRGRG